MNRIVFGALLTALAIDCPAQALDTFSFTPAFSGTLRWGVQIDGGTQQLNPTLHVMRGQTYDFTLVANSAHPFYIKTVKGNTTANAYPNFPGNGTASATSKTISFTIPTDAPDTLFYDCSIHSSMGGEIDVSIFRDGFGD
jgi:hypothetical protein